jgi:hypothetical protein
MHFYLLHVRHTWRCTRAQLVGAEEDDGEVEEICVSEDSEQDEEDEERWRPCQGMLTNQSITYSEVASNLPLDLASAT